MYGRIPCIDKMLTKIQMGVSQHFSSLFPFITVLFAQATTRLTITDGNEYGC